MKNKKKIIISIIVLIFVIGLIRGNFVIETNFNSKKYENKVEIPKEDLEEYINKDSDYVEYFDNLDDALNKSELTDYKGVINILKTFEIGNNVALFTTEYGEENSKEFSRYRLKVKNSGEQKEYSEVLDGVSIDYTSILSSSNKIVKEMEGDEETRLWRNFGLTNQPALVDPVNIIKDKYKNFKWSVTDIENVKYLKINGEKPDEIIPFTLDGNELYFYYYLDLELDINEMENYLDLELDINGMEKCGSGDFKIEK